MGLDIYLHTAAEQAANDEYDRKWSEWYDSGLYESQTEEERVVYRAKHDINYPSGEHRDVTSSINPEHICTRRYLRSSYNAGGFNNVTEAVAKDGDEERGFYYIFHPMGREWDGDEGDLTAEDIPNLRECKERALEMAVRLEEAPNVRVTTISPNPFSPPPTASAQDALEWYQKCIGKYDDNDVFGKHGWSDNVGSFYGPEGMKIYAAVSGVDDSFIGSLPCTHIIHEFDMSFYVEAAKICAEFCDEAIDLIEKDGSVQMSWSG
jgi:hypothetical protein